MSGSRTLMDALRGHGYEDGSPATKLSALTAYVSAHGGAAQRFSYRLAFDTQGAALWEALAPLVEAGVLTDDEQVMLVVCRRFAHYPITPTLVTT